MKCSWREGNKIQLLENGEQYYPAVFTAIGEAQERIILETFIWFEDDVGKQLHAALLAAAQRGVKAEVLLDGYGSPDLSDEFVNELTAAGVVFRYYDPRPRLLVCAPMCFAGCIANCGDRRAYSLYWRAELLRRAYVQLRSRGQTGLRGTP